MSKSAGNRSAAEESPALLTQRPRNERKGSEKEMEKIVEFIQPLHELFYGEHWFISWGIVVGIILIAGCFQLPSFIKSLKAAKARDSKKA